ncbi:uncharacterized protein VTP21DRAFT_6876 [Calcarisporiella thermophila]|uniref:uncharacterized protein n=1 Tax=Calcarisporiella thermophila TaxID=911321 RepID=UPI003743133A
MSTGKDLNTREGKNRFKYQSFKTRVESLKIDVVHRVRRKDDDPEEFGSYFNEALQEWKELNLTQHFVRFVREIEKYSQSLAMILYHKEKIVDVLERHIQVPDSLAIEPLLDLVTKLAKDLGEEFFPYYERIFSVIIPLVKHRDVKILEWTFNCFAYLFKYLAKQLSADLRPTYRLIAPLLGEHQHKPYIRHFAAESFGYLLRKPRAKELKVIIAYILESLRTTPTEDYVEGLSMLFFESIKQVDGRLHSRGLALLSELMEQLHLEQATSEAIENNSTYRVVSKTYILLVHHCKKEHFGPITEHLLEEATRAAKQMEEDINETTVMGVAKIVSMIRICVAVRKASRIQDLKSVFNVVKNISRMVFSKEFTPTASLSFLISQLHRLTTLLLTLGKLEEILVGGKAILNSVFEYNDPVPVMAFTLNLATLKWEHFTQVMLPYILNFMTAHWKTHSSALCIFFARLVALRALTINSGMISSFVTQDGLIRFPSQKKGGASLVVSGLLQILKEERDWAAEVDSLSKMDVTEASVEPPALTIITSAITILPHISTPLDDTIRALNSIFKSLLHYLNSHPPHPARRGQKRPLTQGPPSVLAESLLGNVIETIALISRRSAKNNEESLESMWEDVEKALLNHSSNVVMLRGVFAFLEAMKLRPGGESRFTVERLETFVSKLQGNLGDFRGERRLYTLRILDLFPKLQMLQAENSDSSNEEPELCDIISQALVVENIQTTVQTYRDKTMEMRKLGLLISTRRVPALYREVVPRICLAWLTINFKPLWSEAIDVLEKVSQSDSAIFWQLIYQELMRFEDEPSLVENGLSSEVLTQYFEQQEEPQLPPINKIGGLQFGCPTLNRYESNFERSMEFMETEFSKSCVMQFVDMWGMKQERIDYANYYGLLLKALVRVPHVPEQRSKQLVPLFFKFLENEYEAALEDGRGDSGDPDEMENNAPKSTQADDQMDVDEEDRVIVLEHSARMAKVKMAHFLELFAKFKAIKSISQSERLENVFLRLLTKGDIKLQRQALDCVLAWRAKSPAVTGYADHLRNLVDEVKFRDELSTFSFDQDESPIEMGHRAELMPIVIRIIFGRMMARKGKASATAGMGARRTASLAALAGCSEAEIGYFIELMLEPFSHLRSLHDMNDGSFVVKDDIEIGVVIRKQAGFLHVLGDVIKQLGAYVLPFVPDLIKIVIYLTACAQKKLENEASGQSKQRDEDMQVDEQAEVDEEDEDEEAILIDKAYFSRLREVRQLGIRRIVEFFKLRTAYDYTAYLPAMFNTFITPRIPLFHIENTQAPSVLLELFLAWSMRREYVGFLAAYNDEVLRKVYACLSAKKVRDTVVSMVLQIAENILRLCSEEADELSAAHEELHTGDITSKVLLPYVPCLLNNLEHLLLRSSEQASFGRSEFSSRQIAILSQISEHVTNGEQASQIVTLLLPCLKKSPRAVPERTKANILIIIGKFLHILPGMTDGSPLFSKLFTSLMPLFGTLATRECRLQMIPVLREFAKIDSTLEVIVTVVDDLNAYSLKRLDEPDFDRRLNAFNKVNLELCNALSELQWIPVLHNFLFFMGDMEELSVRTSASHGVTLFIDRCADAELDEQIRLAFQGLLTHVVYPAIKRGVRSNHEQVRSEFVGVLGHAVKKCSFLPAFADLVPLLAQDEESNFFNNLYHMQMHRRMRAIRRLATECQSGVIRSGTLFNLMAPLVMHFIFEADRIADHNLIQDSIQALGAIAGQLRWGQYHMLLKKFLKLLPKKTQLEKVLVRTVIAILDAFHFDLRSATVTEETLAAMGNKQRLVLEPMELPDGAVSGQAGDNAEGKQAQPNAAQTEAKVEDKQYAEDKVEEKAAAKGQSQAEEEEVEEEEEEEVEEQEEEAGASASAMDETALSKELITRIHDTLVTKLLPELHRYLTQRDETSVMVRIPVALSITKLLTQLPESSLKFNLPGLLTSVCQILRSRQQEARDATRDTLLKISEFLGADYFSFIVSELRGALQRGYQRHVLGFTLNSLLVHMVPRLQVGDIDHCLSEVVEVLVDDIFGEIAEEKEVDELRGKMRESKSVRSFESFELLGKIVRFKSVGVVLIPIRDIMRETESKAVTRKLDEVLRRLAVGLNGNAQFETKEMLVFCHGLISQSLQFTKIKEQQQKKKEKKSALEVNFTVQLKRDVREPVDRFSANAHRFVEFGLGILNTALKRGRFDVQSQEELEMLDPFVDAVGNALFSKNTSVISLATKVLAILCKLPLPGLEKALPAIIKRVFSLLKGMSGSTTSELGQNCFKLLTVAIRDNKQSEITEQQLVYLIHLILPDLEEPERQGTAFALIRAIVSRKLVAPEVYDMMQAIAEIMVTSQDAQVREQCRHVYLQFLLDYPQGRGRLKNQMEFLATNLGYPHENGRVSVMEMLNVIFAKFGEDILNTFADKFFIALVTSLVSDESSRCREMAGALIKSLMLRMTKERLGKTYAMMDKWFAQEAQSGLQQAAAQVYGLAVEAFREEFRSRLSGLLDQLVTGLTTSSDLIEKENAQKKANSIKDETREDKEMDSDEEESMEMETSSPAANDTWETTLQILLTLEKVLHQFPHLINSSNTITHHWPLVRMHILHPQAKIRLVAMRLWGIRFATIDPSTRYPKNQEDDSTSDEAKLKREELRDFVQLGCVLLRDVELSEELATQVVKNLFFVGKCLYHLPPSEDIARTGGDVVEDEENVEALGDSNPDIQEEESEDEEDENEDGDDANKEEEEENEQVASEDQSLEMNGSPVKEKAGPVFIRKSLLWMFKKFSFQARGAMIKDKQTLQRTFIFKWFAAMSNYIDSEDLGPYLIPIISPIYRMVNDETAKGKDIEELRRLGQEVLDLVQKRAGTTRYVTAYSQVQRRVAEMRHERKAKRSLRAITDPQASARRRLQKNEMKRAARKRKNEAFAAGKVRLTVRKKRRTDA